MVPDQAVEVIGFRLSIRFANVDNWYARGRGRLRPVAAYRRLAAPAFHLRVEKYAQNRGQYEMHFVGDAKRSAIQRNPTDLIIQRAASDAILSQRRAVIIWRWSMIQPCLNTVHLSSMYSFIVNVKYYLSSVSTQLCGPEASLGLGAPLRFSFGLYGNKRVLDQQFRYQMIPVCPSQSHLSLGPSLIHEESPGEVI